MPVTVYIGNCPTVSTASVGPLGLGITNWLLSERLYLLSHSSSLLSHTHTQRGKKEEKEREKEKKKKGGGGERMIIMMRLYHGNIGTSIQIGFFTNLSKENSQTLMNLANIII